MSYLVKWKKAFYAAFAMGIIGFATYGLYHTVLAFNDLEQSQNGGITLTSSPLDSEKNLVPGGTFCNPYGCAGCSGCVSLQYQQNIDVLPGSGSQIEQTY